MNTIKIGLALVLLASLHACGDSRPYRPLTADVLNLCGPKGTSTILLRDSISGAEHEFQVETRWLQNFRTSQKFGPAGSEDYIYADYTSEKRVDTTPSGYPMKEGWQIRVNLEGTQGDAEISVQAEYDTTEIDPLGQRRYKACYGTDLHTKLTRSRIRYTLPNGDIEPAVILASPPLDTLRSMCQGLYVQEILMVSGYGLVRFSGSLQSTEAFSFNRVARRFRYVRTL